MNKKFERFIRQDQLVLTAIILWVSLDFLILGKYSRVLVGDEGDSVLSGLLSMSHTDQLRPLWTPYAVAGTDRLATTFFPELWSALFHIFPGWLTYQISRVFIVAGGVCGIFWLCRNKFKLSRLAALFAALLAAIQLGDARLFMSPVAYMPIVIVTLNYLFEDIKSLSRWVIAGAICIFYTSSSLPQFMILFAPAFAALWFLFIEGLTNFRNPRVWRQWIIIVLFFMFVYLFRGQELLALLFNAPMSMRAEWGFYKLSVSEAIDQGLAIMRDALDPSGLISFWPYANINATLLAFYLAIAVAVVTRLRDPLLRRLLLLIVACATLVVFMPVVRTLLYDVMPAIRGFSVNKLWDFAFVAVMPAAGFAYHVLESRTTDSKFGNDAYNFQRWIRAAPFIFLIAFSLIEKGISTPREWITQGSYKQIYESPVIENLARSVKAKGEPVRVASFQMYDMFVNAYGLESPGGQVDMYSKRYNQLWERILDPSIDDDLVRKKYLSTSSTLELGHTFVKADKLPERLIGDLFRLNLLSLVNVGYILSRDRLLDPELKLVNDDAPKRPWSSLSVTEKVLISAADNFQGRRHLYVYENTAVLPRYFLAEKLTVLDDRTAVLDALSESTTKALRKTAFISRDDWPETYIPPPYSANGQIRLNKYSADEIVFSTNLAGPGLLVVTNSFSPFWSCLINGKPATIHPVDLTFWGVELPENAKTVTFRYEPPYGL
jgi:hypothetical protein